MLSLPGSVKVFVRLCPTDMRRSFDSLAGLVLEEMKGEPLSGHLFVFLNRGADRVKVLYWDRDGYALWYKRLEEGRFRLPAAEGKSIELSRSELVMILEGIDLGKGERPRRYSHHYII